MNTLITPSEVISIAFPGNSNIREESISDMSIHIAERKHLLAAFGDLYYQLREPQYNDFVQRYIKPTLAYYVKCEIMPSLAINMSNAGLALVNPQYMTTATDKQRQLLYDSEMTKADTLLAEAVEYILGHPEEFPTYKTIQPQKTQSRKHFVL